MSPHPSHTNLSGLIRQVLADTDLSDPREVAAEVSRRLRGAAALRDALMEALPVYVRTQFTRDRLLPRDLDTAPVIVSSKVAAVRSDWQRRLETPVVVDGVWKRLGECTSADLLAVASALRVQAAQSVAKAEYYETLAAKVPAGGVVSDLAADPLGVAA